MFRSTFYTFGLFRTDRFKFPLIPSRTPHSGKNRTAIANSRKNVLARNNLFAYPTKSAAPRKLRPFERATAPMQTATEALWLLVDHAKLNLAWCDKKINAFHNGAYLHPYGVAWPLQELDAQSCTSHPTEPVVP